MDSNHNSHLFSGKGPGDVNKLEIINVKKFLESRGQEIEEMFELFKKTDKKQRIFQKLPFVMRRRAMSHNPFKIPKNIRIHILREMAKNNPKACKRIRKDKRKRLNRLEEYQQRFQKNKWLETHLYHAKRFKMETVWGYRLAATWTQKSKRRFLRYLKQRCVIHDRSYEEVVSVTGDVSKLEKSFKGVFEDSFLMFQSVYMSCKTRGTTLCYSWNKDSVDKSGTMDMDVDEPRERNLIGPVHYIWLPEKDKTRTVWLFAHPGSTGDLMETLSSYNELKLEMVPDMVKFELFGPLSMLLLKKLLDVDGSYSYSNRIWESMEVTNNSASHSYVLPLFISVPLVYGNAKPFYLATTAKYENKENRSMVKVEVMTKDEDKLNEERLKFYEYKSEKGQIKVNNVLRIRKRRDYSKIVKQMLETLSQNKEKEVLSKSEGGDEREYKTTNDVKEEEYKVEVEVEKKEDEKKIPILVVFRNNKPYGLDVIMPPNSNASRLWILMNRCGAMSFGYNERQEMVNLFGMSSFPQDYPETKVGKKYYDELFRNEIMKYISRPASKRVNYSFLGVDNAFALPVNLKDQKVDFSPEVLNKAYQQKSKKMQSCNETLFKSKYLLLTSLCSGLYHYPTSQKFRVLRLSTFGGNESNLYVQKLVKQLIECLNNGVKSKWVELVPEECYVTVKVESAKGPLNHLSRLYEVEPSDLKTIPTERIKEMFKNKGEIREYMRVKEQLHEEYKMSNLKTKLELSGSKSPKQAVVQSVLSELNKKGIKNSKNLMGFISSKGLVNLGVGFAHLRMFMRSLENILMILKGKLEKIIIDMLDYKVYKKLSLEEVRVPVWFRHRDSREYYLGVASLMFHDLLTGIY